MMNPLGSSILRVTAVAAAIWVTRPGDLRAQTDRTISGVVTDLTNGAPVEEVTVYVSGTGWIASTDAAGRFAFRSIPPGRWIIATQRVGYRPGSTDYVAVSEGFESTVRIAMEPEPVILPRLEVTAVSGDRLVLRRIDLPDVPTGSARPLTEVLQQIPGVRVYGSPESPGGTRISIGGEPAERVAVMLNGVPLSSGPNGAVNFDAIPAAALRRIELRSGGQSASVGDAGVGGVLNLVTSTSHPDHEGETRAEATAGSFGTYRGSAAWNGDMLRSDCRLTWEVFGRGASFRYPSGGISALRSGVQETGQRFFAEIETPGRKGISSTAFVYRAASGLPGAIEQATPGAANDDERLRWQARWPIATDAKRQLSASTWYESSHQRYRSPTMYKADSDMRDRLLGARLEAQTDHGNRSASLLIDVRKRRLEGYDRLDPAVSFGTHTRTEYAIRGTTSKLCRTTAGILEARLGAALDMESDRHPIFSPRLDLLWNAGRGIQTRVGWGRSFRRPQLTSLFWKADAFAAGNPQLRPERATEWDAALGWTHRGFAADTRYFERSVTDIIVWDRDFTGKYRPQNLSHSWVFGREDHIRLEYDGQTAGVGCDYVHVLTGAYDRSGEPNQDGRELIFTPRHTHDLRLHGRIGRVSARTSGRWVARRYSRRANTKWLAPYRTFDAALEVTCRRRDPAVTLGINGENLTDEQIELLERYPSPGRSWSLTASVRF